MFHGAMTYIRSCNNPHCTAHNPANQRFSLILQYTNTKHDIKLDTEVASPPTLTIHQITKDVIEFLYLDDIPIEEIRLAGFSRNGRHQVLEKTDAQMTLQQLGLTNGCTLHFVPTPNASPPKLCQLTIVGPDEIEKKDFEWYRAKTTVGELLKYVIEHFSLQSVEQERIHLITIIDELDFADNLDMRLSEFDLHSGMLVHVQIIPPLSRTTVNKNMDVHVEYTSNNEKCVLNIPNTATINELKIRLKSQYEDRDMIDFKLYNENKEELSLIDPDRTLKSVGVKSGRTISAAFRLITRNTQPPVVNNHNEVSTKSSASPTTKKKSEKVIVICNYPPDNRESMHVSLKDTVSQLTKKIETKTLNQRLVISEMSSNNIKINLKNDTSRSLADLGFKSDDIINVTMTDKAPTYASIVSSQPPSSPKSDKKSQTHRINKKPVGLDNLGNSCYMNSALQCLAHIPQLTNFFLDSLNYHHMADGEHTDNDWNPFDKVGEVTGAYADLLWKLWRCEENDESYDSLKPNRIKKKIGDKDSRFSTNDQQDAQEFMSFFLDAIHEELKSKNQNDRNTIIKQLFFGEITSIITCTACNKEESTTHPISFLSIPLNRQERKFWVSFIPKQGQSEEAYVDAPISGRVEHVVDEFTRSIKRPYLFYYILAMLPDGEIDFDKSLSEIPTDEMIFMEQEDRTNNPKPKPLEFPTKQSTLEDCLEEFFSPEELQDGWTCQREKCKKKTTATKQLKLHKLPAVLIIQFKRFSHENGLHQKVETSVHYPMKELNLKRFLPRSSSEEAVYDLIAVSTHMGSISGGHYTAYARNTKFNKTAWYRFDDSSVTLVKEQDYEYDIVTRHAYLLFYIKKGISNQVTTV